MYDDSMNRNLYPRAQLFARLLSARGYIPCKIWQMKPLAGREEALEEKKAEDGTATPDKAEQLLEEKMADSKDGTVYLNDTDIRTIIEAAQEEDAGKTTVKDQPQVGANLDLKI